MEFISAEEFLKQPKEVQKVFLEWWKPKSNDIVYVNPELGYNGIDMLVDYTFDSKEYGKMIVVELMACMSQIVIPLSKTTPCYMSFLENMKYITPLLTEGQLRKFIEDKTECFVIAEITAGEHEYYIYLVYKDKFLKLRNQFYKLGTDLLQSYWKVALEIAKECAANE